MKTIEEKRYLRIEFTLSSPLLISSSSSYRTDSDVLRDSRNVPYIPGSSIAGVVRDALKKEGFIVKDWLGDVVKNTGSEHPDEIESKVIFHDAVLTDAKHFSVTVRDSVKLDQFKTCVDGSKFDMEILEPGVKFETFIEHNAMHKDEQILKRIAALFVNGKISFGSKTSRGFGCIEDVNVTEASFELTDTKEACEWLKFDPYKSAGWKEITVNKSKPENTLTLELELVDGVSIRQYTTEIAPEKESAPDYRQLSYRNSEGKTIAVIPGASWAGAFRYRIELFGKDLAEYTYDDKGVLKKGSYFGAFEDDSKLKSQIIFSESKITGGQDKKLSRTAIDRFSGSAAAHALYTESAHFGGTATLTIRFTKPFCRGYSQKFINAFAAAVCDLHHGYLAVGGLTSVGRGIFRICSVNGQKVNSNKLYQTVRTEIENINNALLEDK